MSTRCIIGLIVLLAGTSLTACDTIEEDERVDGRYEAVQYEALVAIRDSLFMMDLLAAGASVQLSLSRAGAQRTVQGRIVIPEGTFADSMRVLANWQLASRRVPAGDLDGVDRNISGSFVTVQRELSLGLDADTTAEAGLNVPTDFTITDRGEQLRGRFGIVVQRRSLAAEVDTFSMSTLILQKQ